jgi:hypothetical protein
MPTTEETTTMVTPGTKGVSTTAGTEQQQKQQQHKCFLFSGHEPIYFIENKEKTLRASYDRGTQIFDYMD